MPISASKLAELWHQHASSLRLLARMRCLSADDCVQEAFIRLASEDPEPEDAHAWLARVVRNLSIDHARRDGRSQVREQRAARPEGQWFTTTETNDLELSGTDCEVALRSLPTELREIVVAHLWNNLPFRKIAEILDMPASTVHRRYREALDTIRNHLIHQCGRDAT